MRRLDLSDFLLLIAFTFKGSNLGLRQQQAFFGNLLFQRRKT